MKKSVLFAFSLFSLLIAGAQTDVTLKINHKLGTEDFHYDVVATNNLGHDFKVERLEYYLTQVTIVHDGGTETAVPLDVVALVQPGEELSTSIPLGSYDVTDIESAKFHIGVHEPVNNEDPALYPEAHPLAPKSPSMHWGWAAGYRFIAYEGVGGVDFSQVFQMHGLGNENYFETTTEVHVVDEDGTLVMNVNGNYIDGLRDLDLTAGVFSHGTIGEAKTVMENWRDHVFGVYFTSLDESDALIDWSVYPNPSSGLVTVNLEKTNTIREIAVLNPLGARVQTTAVGGLSQVNINLEASGVYFVTAIDENGETVATQRLIIE